MTEFEAINFLKNDNCSRCTFKYRNNELNCIALIRGEKCNIEYATELAIKSLEVVNKITDIIKTEQQPTSCEHTKLKSFEMIEKIIADYQLRDSK